MMSVYRVPQMQGVGPADDLLEFKRPATKPRRCHVNAYEKSILTETFEVKSKLHLILTPAASDGANAVDSIGEVV